MGQANRGELERARKRRRRERQSTAARLGVQVRAVRDRGITPDEVAEQERRQARIEREAEGRLRCELADALVTSVHEVWSQELKHAVSDADVAAIDARWAPEVGRAKREARQLAGELTAEQVRARIARYRVGQLLRRALGEVGG